MSCDNQSKEQVRKRTSRPAPEMLIMPEAPVVSFEVDLEDELRTDWQNPQLIIEIIGELENKTVADVGAGSGYFSFKLARSAEKVIALDIDPNALDYINNQKEIVGDWSNNIETRLTPPDVPNLLPNEADIALVVNTFNYIPEKEAYFSRLIDGMKSKGKLFIIDFKKGNIPVGPADEYKADIKEIRTLLRKAGFRSIKEDDQSLQYQFILSAEKR